MRSFKLLAAAVALVLVPALAFASPVPYVTGIFDTPNAVVNTAVASINAAQAPAASLVTASGTTTSTAQGLRVTISVTGLSTAASTLSAAMTVTDASVAANSQVICNTNGYAGTGVPVVVNIVPAAGSFAFNIQNVSTGAALNATVTAACLVFN